MIGMGYHGTHTPPVILRNVLENPGWYTAYTPYQAEVSQGRLEALLNFQQMVADLTGLELANASLLDEATAAAEAMAMAHARPRKASPTASSSTPTATRRRWPCCAPAPAARHRARRRRRRAATARPGAVRRAAPVSRHRPARSATCAPVIDAVHAAGALAIVATDLLALDAADAAGRAGRRHRRRLAQRFGVPMGYGGPHAAFFATRDAHKRAMPGRIIGVSVDAAAQPALRMALQTREQHIRREKATSNICTAQVLLAVIAGMYAVWHGPEGLTRIARRVHRRRASWPARRGRRHRGRHDAFFDTLTLEAAGKADALIARGAARGINLRLATPRIGIALDETTTREDLAALVAAIAEAARVRQPTWTASRAGGLPERCAADAFLTHPVFPPSQRDRDAALPAPAAGQGPRARPQHDPARLLHDEAERDRRDDPGHLARLRPPPPVRAAGPGRGLPELFRALEAWLAEITGFDAISLQPNAGSQGEYAGLLGRSAPTTRRAARASATSA